MSRCSWTVGPPGDPQDPGPLVGVDHLGVEVANGVRVMTDVGVTTGVGVATDLGRRGN